MIVRFISGKHKIAEIERAIASFEYGFVKFIGSEKITQDGVEGNALTFEETEAIILGDFKLQLEGDSPPSGYTSFWSGSMVTNSEVKNILAWRRNELNNLSTVQTEHADDLMIAKETTENENNIRVKHTAVINGSSLRYGVHRRSILTDVGNSVRFSQSPNHSHNIQPLLLVIHYTATTTMRPVINWFAEPASQVSAHLIIDRDGSIMQMVKFDRQAWHAGISQWGNLEYINRYAIGIELVNAGKLRQSPQGWIAWDKTVIPDDEVTEATHFLENKTSGWHEYTPQQLESLWQVGAALNQVFQFQDVVGHDDIAPGRKTDPGPLFPLESIRSRILGRS